MIKGIEGFDFKGLRVLIRVDFNVPLDDKGNITSDKRITASLPTIRKVIDDGGTPVLISHLGRPKGKPEAKYSQKIVADYMTAKMGIKTHFIEDFTSPEGQTTLASVGKGEIALLENIRFLPGEESNDPAFAAELAKLGDCYISDAFGCAHRAHTSTYGLPLLFENRFAGLLLEKELRYLGGALTSPRKPFVAIIGGSKISGKIDVIENLLDKCDSILIGGGMIFTFYRAMGLETGHSLMEEEKIELAGDLIKKAKEKGVALVLPIDIVVASEFTNRSNSALADYDKLPKDMIGMDIGPKSIKLFKSVLQNAATVVWNGPMGVFEMKNFAKGTFGIASALAEITAHGAVTIVGGGDSAAAVKQAGMDDRVSHVSTGGGASLEFLEGKELPGITVLNV